MTDEEWNRLHVEPMKKYKAGLLAVYAVIGVVFCVGLVLWLVG